MDDVPSPRLFLKIANPKDSVLHHIPQDTHRDYAAPLLSHTSLDSRDNPASADSAGRVLFHRKVY